MKSKITAIPMSTLNDEEKEIAETIFTCVATNADDDLKFLLDEYPRLVNVQNANGNTPLAAAVGSGKQADLATARLIISYAGNDPENLKVLRTTANNRGIMPVHCLEDIEGIALHRAFGEAMGIKYKAIDTIIAEAQRDNSAAVARANDYSSRADVKKSDAIASRLEGKSTGGSHADQEAARRAATAETKKKEGCLVM